MLISDTLDLVRLLDKKNGCNQEVYSRFELVPWIKPLRIIKLYCLIEIIFSSIRRKAENIIYVKQTDKELIEELLTIVCCSNIVGSSTNARIARKNMQTSKSFMSIEVCICIKDWSFMNVKIFA